LRIDLGMRDHILGEIRRLAALSDGQAPGQKVFLRETGIGDHHWRGKFWARWGDALTEAGYEPNKWVGRLDSDTVLDGVVAACRHFGRFPTHDEIQLYRRSEPTIPSEQAIRRHFGKRSDLIAALAARASEDESCADIAGLLPVTSGRPRLAASAGQAAPEGFVYLIKSGDFCKIGRSDDIERRFNEIRIALPNKATLIHSIRTDDPVGVEAYWHRRFADRRANGEWFKLTSLDVSAFKKRKYQ
jgi:hypothetical protein